MTLGRRVVVHAEDGHVIRSMVSIRRVFPLRRLFLLIRPSLRRAATRVDS